MMLSRLHAGILRVDSVLHIITSKSPLMHSRARYTVSWVSKDGAGLPQPGTTICPCAWMTHCMYLEKFPVLFINHNIYSMAGGKKISHGRFVLFFFTIAAALSWLSSEYNEYKGDQLSSRGFGVGNLALKKLRTVQAKCYAQNIKGPGT